MNRESLAAMFHARGPSGVRGAEIFDQAKGEYEAMALEVNRLKQINEEYERKLEQQIGELESIQRTLYELQNNQSSLKHKYDDEIMRLRRQVEEDERVLPSAKRHKPDDMLPHHPKEESQHMHGSLPSLPSAVQPLHQSSGQGSSSGRGSVGRGDLPSAAGLPTNPEHPSLPSQRDPLPGSRRFEGSVEPLPRLSAAGPQGLGGGEGGRASPPGPSALIPPIPSSGERGASSVLPGIHSLRAEGDAMQNKDLPVRRKDEPMQDAEPFNERRDAPSPKPPSPERREHAGIVPGGSNGGMSMGMGMGLGNQRPGERAGGAGGRDGGGGGGNGILNAMVLDRREDSPNSMGDEQAESPSKEDGPDWEQMPPGDDIELMHTLPHNSVVCCVRFSQDGKYVATGSNKIAQVFDVVSGEVVASFNTETRPSAGERRDDDDENEPDAYVRSVCFSPDGSILVAGAEDLSIKMWDIADKRLIRTLRGHDNEIYSLDFSHDSKMLVSGSGDKKAKLWDLETGNCLHELGGGGEHEHMDGVTSVSFSPDLKHVVTGNLDRIIRLWDVQTGQCVNVFEGHEQPVYSVVFSPDGSSLASGSLDRTLRLWDVSTGKCRSSHLSHSDFVLSVAFAKNGEWMVSGSKDRTVAFWDPDEDPKNGPRVSLQGHKNSVISVGVSPSTCVFATGSGDSRARIWCYDKLKKHPNQ